MLPARFTRAREEVGKNECCVLVCTAADTYLTPSSKHHKQQDQGVSYWSMSLWPTASRNASRHLLAEASTSALASSIGSASRSRSVVAVTARPRPCQRLSPTIPSFSRLSSSNASSYDSDPDPVVRLASLALDGHSSTSSTDLESLDPSSPQYAQAAKTLSEQHSLRSVWSSYKSLSSELSTASKMVTTESDEQMRALAQDEVDSLQSSLDSIRHELSEKLFPPEPIHDAGALIELRPGIGGEESCMFVGEMARMYERWLAVHYPQFTVETLSSTSSSNEFAGAMKEVILQVSGTGPYGLLRFEAGVHRVQRIPVTTSVAKMQSSTITIVVLPLADQTSSMQTNVNDIVDPKDVKVETMRARGAGGQHVNKTESAIRLTHIPTGTTVSMQDSRSQHSNREKAWAVLRSRLLDRHRKEQEEHERSLRGEQIVGMTRGDRVRTYNWQQDRITDHRLQLNATAVDDFMQGTPDSLADFITELALKERQNMVQSKLNALQRATAGEASDGKKSKK